MSDPADPWTVAHQAPLSFTISQSLLKFMSIELVMLHSPVTLCHPFSFSLQYFPTLGFFPVSWPLASGGQSIGASALKKKKLKKYDSQGCNLYGGWMDETTIG